MHHQRTKCFLWLLIWFVGIPTYAGAVPLAEQVSAARADVDSAAERLESLRLTVRDDLAALRAERAELQRQVRLEKIRTNTLTRLIEERTKRVDVQEGQIQTLLIPIKQSVAATKAYVSTTLPFKREERLRRLNRIDADLSVTHPDLGRALTNLWRFVEEEASMAREIGLAQQVVELSGQRLLADVVRIGMALMYFRLPSGEIGWVRKVDDAWRFEKLEAAAPRAAIAQLFKDVESNQRLGSKTLVISRQLPSPMKREVQ